MGERSQAPKRKRGRERFEKTQILRARELGSGLLGIETSSLQESFPGPPEGSEAGGEGGLAGSPLGEVEFLA